MEKIIELKFNVDGLAKRNKEFLEQQEAVMRNYMQEKMDEQGFVTKREVYEQLYEQFYRKEPTWEYATGWCKPAMYYSATLDDCNWGWTKENPELHRLSTREKNPEFCPCCGRPW